MSIPLPAEIEFTELADGVRYTLPRRRLDRFHALGSTALIAFGLFFSGLPFFLVVLPALRSFLAGRPGAGLSVLPLLAVAPFFFVGVAIVAWVVLMLVGSCAVEIRDGMLRTMERAGPFHWTRSRPVENIRKLEVRLHPRWMSITRVMGKERIKIGPLSDSGNLVAECEDAKPLALLLAYPRTWLVNNGIVVESILFTAETPFYPSAVQANNCANAFHLTNFIFSGGQTSGAFDIPLATIPGIQNISFDEVKVYLLGYGCGTTNGASVTVGGLQLAY